jgi:acyl-CoA reductase-like NAD-dependent aldehyde dehydrogenase
MWDGMVMNVNVVDWIERAANLDSHVKNFVNGRYVDNASKDAQLEKHGPRDGKLLYRFTATNGSEVDEAVQNSRQAFEDGRWANVPVQRRKEVLLKLADLLDASREEFALYESLDVGKPINDSFNFDVPVAAALLRFSAEAIDKVAHKVYNVDRSNLSYQLKRPVGVVAAIVGWNFPLALSAGKVGPALAAGNALVLKPSEFSSRSASRLAELALEAGLPEGVFNVIHGGGNVGAALARRDDVDLLSFTGSTRTGKKLLVASGESNMKRLLLECGGKAANIVFEDCPDLNHVADAIIGRAFWNQGQVCTASSRVLVHEDRREELLSLLISKAEQLQLGDPLHHSTRYGALVSQEHKAKVLKYIGIAREEGGQAAYCSSSAPPFAAGYYVGPVIFDRVEPSHTVAREEIFGPVVSVLTFRDEAEAMRIANDTIYGLSAILWTTDFAKAHRATQSLSVGWTVVNMAGVSRGGPGFGVLAIGGHKQSGIGIEGGVEGLQEYMSNTAVQIFS